MENDRLSPYLESKIALYTARGWQYASNATCDDRADVNPLNKAMAAVHEEHPDHEVTYILDDKVDMDVREAVVVRREKEPVNMDETTQRRFDYKLNSPAQVADALKLLARYMKIADNEKCRAVLRALCGEEYEQRRTDRHIELFWNYIVSALYKTITLLREDQTEER